MNKGIINDKRVAARSPGQKDVDHLQVKVEKSEENLDKAGYLRQKGKGLLTVKTSSASGTFSLGEQLGALAEPGEVICLKGELGTGKTVLAKGVACGLGVAEVVTSPTFTLINEYQGRLPFYHLDVYRLSSPLEMADLGYEEYFYGSGVTLIEWAERVAEILPAERLDIYLLNLPELENTREINFFPQGKRYLCLVEELSKLVCSRD